MGRTCVVGCSYLLSGSGPCCLDSRTRHQFIKRGGLWLSPLLAMRLRSHLRLKRVLAVELSCRKGRDLHAASQPMITPAGPPSSSRRIDLSVCDTKTYLVPVLRVTIREPHQLVCESLGLPAFL